MIITRARSAGALVTALAVISAFVTPAAASVAGVRAAGDGGVYRLSDSGRHVTVDNGDTIKLNLRTDRDGGFKWAVTKRAGAHTADVVSKTVKPYHHGKHQVGYPYHTIYTLQGVRHGEGTIRFTERQPFHKSSVAATFVIHVHVPKPPKSSPPSNPKHSCTRTSSGSCIQGGEFCPQADYGQSGWDANGTRYVCKGDSEHPHWEIP